jgi:hypothetical protein
MKTLSTVLRFTFSILFFCAAIMSEAKDIYVSSNGDDTHDGTSTSSPYKTISRAITEAMDGDVIHVSGIIKIKNEPNNLADNENKNGNHINVNGSVTYTNPTTGIVYRTWNAGGNNGVKMLSKELTIVGFSKSDGFDGEKATRLFKLDGTAKKVTFKNLTFKNGCSDPNSDQGPAFYIRGGVPPVFEGCIFSDSKNTSSVDGGAFYYASPQSLTETSVFKQCTFRNNFANNGANFFITCGNYEFTECVMEKSNLTSGRGGAMMVRLNQNQAINILAKKSVFQNNAVYGNGGVLFFEDGGSGAYQCNMTFEACAFLNNTSNDNGGAFFVDNKTTARTINLTVINSTFYNNSSRNQGGAIDINKGETGSELNLVNCTLTENIAGNVNNGGGVRFMNDGSFSSQKMTKRILNTIIENNRATNNARSDISIQSYTPTVTDLVIDRSFIGITKDAFSVSVANNYQNSNKINYDDGNTEPINIFQPANVVIELYQAIALQYGSATAPRSAGIGYGDANYLQERNIHFDQIGKWRSFEGGACNIGSVEVEVWDMEEELADWTVPAGSGIEKHIISPLNVKVYHSNNTLTLEGYTDEGGILNVQVSDISGRLIQTAAYPAGSGTFKETISLPALPKGIYIAKIRIGKTNSIVKFIN